MNEIKDTSGPVASSESEKKMLEKSKDDHMNEETAEVELTPLIDNPLVKTSSGIQGETFVKLTEDIARSDEAPQDDPVLKTHIEDATDQIDIGDAKTKEKIKEESEQLENGESLVAVDEKEDDSKENHVTEALVKQEKVKEDDEEGAEGYIPSSEFDSFLDGDDSGTEDQQSAFMKEIENFYKEKSLEFKAPKFYGEGLNCLKLWRQVTKLGGYDKVTSCKLWRQVGESFKPPKTCTTVSWTFRIFYEKALLEYEKHKIQTGELQVPISSAPEPIISEHQVSGNQSSGSGRARRDAAARAMQGWHSQRLLGNGEVGDPIIKADKSSFQLPKREKHLKGLGGGIKRKKASGLEHSVKFARTKDIKQQ